jgi:poly(A) polymerase
LSDLSGERIRAELLRLLAAPRAAETLAVMDDAGFVERVLGSRGDLKLMSRVASIEQALDRSPDALLRLGALAAARPGASLALRDRLRLAGTEFERLARMAMPDKAFDPATPEREAKAFLYRHGNEAFSDGAILAWARSSDPPGHAQRLARLTLPAHWQPPPLPVRGSDVMALGVAEGPAVGRVVRAFEDWWVAEDFPTDATVLTAALRRLATTSGT